MDTIETKLKSKFDTAREDTKAALFKEWCSCDSAEEREAIHATLRALSKLTFYITRSINGDK